MSMADKPKAGTAPARRADFRRERRLLATGFLHIAGLDEAGRGPLAGPVAAAAVILDPARLPRGVHDSKQLDAAEREEMFALILARAVAVSVSLASTAEIDVLNIRAASLLAMRRALAGLSLKPCHALIDGRDIPSRLTCHGADIPAEALIGGDALSMSIAAASIVAKVTRDRLMARLAKRYPHYGFEQHAGYATRRHLDAIAAHGPCPAHRMTFSPMKPKLALV